MFSVPYHILIHDKTSIGAIYVLSRHLYGAGGVQKMAILEGKTGFGGPKLYNGENETF